MDTTPTEQSPRAAKRLQMIARLADLSMALAEHAAATTLSDPNPAPEALLAYARIARCVRQTLACEARLEKSPELPSDAARDAARQSRAARRRPQIRREVERAIANDPAHDPTARETENLLLDLEERLQDKDLLHTLATAPLEDIVLQLCEDLGVYLNPSEMSDEALDRAILRHNPDFDLDAEPPYDPTDEDDPVPPH